MFHTPDSRLATGAGQNLPRIKIDDTIWFYIPTDAQLMPY